MPKPDLSRGPTRVFARAVVLLLCLTLWPLLAVAQDAGVPRIGVATMQPGDVFFERFGHNALVVDDPAQPEPLSYNFGFFDPNEPDFVPRFIRGDMRYMLAALPLADDLAYYRDVGRGVSIQWLDLDPAQARELASALAENAKPENAHYRYDYFTDNCSTRVRDAIDTALGGALRGQLQGRSRGNTYRGDAVRLASPALWMWLGFDIGLGPSADRPNALWEDAFVPMRLADALRSVRNVDGRPLVSGEQIIVPHTQAPEPAERARLLWPWLVAGLVLGAAILVVGRFAPRALAAIALPFWTLSALLGGVMLFLWLGSEHVFAWRNHNLLLFNPLCLLLLPGGWRIARGRAPGALFRWVLATVLVCGIVALFLHWLPVLPQRNAAWLSLLMPVHVGLFWVLRRRPTGLTRNS
ncbi:DUF4105 domain-containing protein [Luteimonas fraxinea]|uniref:DUF4105 domain-containing protein n=1 Tax=Luteimonas fraxinea TaxID=2901869 RepID=A0ABS8UI66_9GAMM|nr:DUF4105 domain-containing protein [Luteimonas fraxinea]MCD9098537.1 DUF4105 domain-containing protein [Luteimonas fraxinea]MCD9127270.1 DUF4105 domain-containing protein [Luteimonas fraxinea]UHH10645.1 DUF4105 domain-containing protein [Luteimonas fraxinea]